MCGSFALKCIILTSNKKSQGRLKKVNELIHNGLDTSKNMNTKKHI